ncbi:MAG: type II toxin-antitoxin system prevent-host-death family antitoxin [Planctomycetes bacterium]|nr:type II toxin-antitoxin system prevent-host-death family antitoxin [Planctomycetota bacterium]
MTMVMSPPPRRRDMEEMAISRFKATCLAVVERVRRTRRPVRITRRGEPVAEVVPPSAPRGPDGWIGSMAGTLQVRGDIVGPVSRGRDWEALRR